MTAQRYPAIAREGWPIIGSILALFVLLSAAGYFFHLWAGLVVAFIGVVITVWAVWFFRDPERAVPSEPGLMICGADGVVSFIGPCEPPPELGLPKQGTIRVSIFMNIFNVHVNRVPAKCRIEKISYRPGKFFNAAMDKASEHNERLSMILRLPDGRRIVLVQIAGLIARRIVCRVKEGAELEAGERFGLIRFGSRVDHYLPAGIQPLVKLGERTFAGQTILAHLSAPVPLASHHEPSLAAQEA